jgi:hypothetical protein
MSTKVDLTSVECTFCGTWIEAASESAPKRCATQNQVQPSFRNDQAVLLEMRISAQNKTPQTQF